MTPLLAIQFSAPILAAGCAVALTLLFSLFVWRSRRKAKKAAVAKDTKASPPGFTIILMRGSSPTGAIIPGCVFVNGWYTLDPKAKNPIAIPFEGNFVRRNSQPGGEPFFFYDMESQGLVHYTGVCKNDDEVTLVHHDGTVEEVTAQKAKDYEVNDVVVQGKKTVFRKHVSLWKRWPGSRLFAEKTTMDWNAIQSQIATWLAILQQYFPMIAIFFFVILVIIGLVAVF